VSGKKRPRVAFWAAAIGRSLIFFCSSCHADIGICVETACADERMNASTNDNIKPSALKARRKLISKRSNEVIARSLPSERRSISLMDRRIAEGLALSEVSVTPGVPIQRAPLHAPLRSRSMEERLARSGLRGGPGLDKALFVGCPEDRSKAKGASGELFCLRRRYPHAPKRAMASREKRPFTESKPAREILPRRSGAGI
jgi:hypothetical protein